MRGAGHDAGANEETGLLERELKRIGLGFPIDKVVLGAGDEKDADSIVGIGRVADRRGVEINSAICRGGRQ